MESAKLNNPTTAPNGGCVRAIGAILFATGGITAATAFFSIVFGLAGDMQGAAGSMTFGAISGGIGWYLVKKYKKTPPTPTNYEQFLLKLASEQGGRLKVGVVALKLGMNIDAASQLLNHYANKGVAQAEVDEKGVITYVFPDFLP